MAETSIINVNSRKSVNITGVDGIISFSENEAVLSTVLGYAAVTGEGLTVECFDRDNCVVDITGTVNAVFYPGGKKEEKSFLKRIFGSDRS